MTPEQIAALPEGPLHLDPDAIGELVSDATGFPVASILCNGRERRHAVAQLLIEARDVITRADRLLRECLPYVREGLEYQHTEPEARKLLDQLNKHLEGRG
jgi:hypothetical protein